MQALTLQEGVFMCPDKRTAFTIASWANDGGAVFVEIMTAQHYDIKRVTEEDVKKVDEFTRSLTRRGRPPVSKYWTVYCIHEGMVRVSHESHAIRCPDCGSLMIRAKEGSPVYYQRLHGENLSPHDIIEYWKNTRFANGKFFIPFEIAGTVGTKMATEKSTESINIVGAPDDMPDIENETDKEYFDLMMRKDNYDRLSNSLDHMKDASFSYVNRVDFLDAIFTSGRFYPDEKDRNRMTAITHVAQAGVEIPPGTLLISSDKIDMFDSWPHWEKRGLISVAKKMYGTALDI
jgi:hypothetical protein